MDVNNRPIILIRFNPDDYTDKNGKRVTTCWRPHGRTGLLQVTKKKSAEWEARMQSLFDRLDYWFSETATEPLTVEYLYYDHDTSNDPVSSENES